MKLNTQALLLSTAIAVISGTASAGLLPGNNPANGNTYFAGEAQVDLELNIAGASAPDVALKDLIKDVCVANTLTTFTDTCQTGTTSATSCGTGVGKAVGSSYSGYFCTVDHTKVSGMAADKNVFFHKRSAGGSFQGTVPVAYAQLTQTQMNINSANCGVTADTSIYKCSNASTFTGAAAIPDMGTSDLPPGEFVTPNVATGSSECDSNCTTNLDTASNYALTIGAIVDSKLYVALQKAQGLNSDSNGDSIDDVTQQSVFAANAALQPAFIANMPSLTEEQLASVYAGKVANWNKVFYNDVAVTAFSGPSDSRVFVCRRSAGSGTQAAINAVIMHVPCTSAADFPATDNTTCLSNTGVAATTPAACATATWASPIVPSATTTPVIHEGSGSGDVDNCMQAINDAGKWSIGLMGLDRSPITQGNGKWAFIKINGVEPTLSNVARGKYPLWGGESVQWRNKAVNQDNNASNALVPAPTGDQLAIMTTLRSNASNPTELNTINLSLTYPFGNAGALDLINTTIRPFNASLPVMQYTRSNKTCNVSKPISTATGLGVDFGL